MAVIFAGLVAGGIGLAILPDRVFGRTGPVALVMLCLALLMWFTVLGH